MPSMNRSLEQILTHSAGTKIAVKIVVSHYLLFISGWTKAAQQKARSEQQESGQSSNKRARIDFASSTTSAAQRVSGTHSDANNPYLQHHSRAVPTAPPRKSRFGAQYGAGSIEQMKSGRRAWG